MVVVVVDGCSTIPILWPYITRARSFPRCTHTHLYRCSVVLSFPDTYNCWSRPVFFFLPDSHVVTSPRFRFAFCARVCAWRARARIRLRTAETCAVAVRRLRRGRRCAFVFGGGFGVFKNKTLPSVRRSSSRSRHSCEMNVICKKISSPRKPQLL